MGNIGEWDAKSQHCPVNVLWSFPLNSCGHGEGEGHHLYVPGGRGVWSYGELWEERT